jgi:hypothetical protein
LAGFPGKRSTSLQRVLKGQATRQGMIDMAQNDFPRLRMELVSHVQARTGARVRNLDIRLSPEGVVLHGQTTAFYIKQLAQHGVRDLLPDVHLQNAIEVA